MKTLNKYLLSLGLILSMMAGQAIARDIESNGKNDPENDYNFTERYDLAEYDGFSSYFDFYQMEREIEKMLVQDGKVKIMNANEEVVIEGNATEESVKKYMRISDLVTEVDGVKYFRMSYK